MSYHEYLTGKLLELDYTNLTLNEIATKLNVNYKTIKKHIDIMEEKDNIVIHYKGKSKEPLNIIVTVKEFKDKGFDKIKKDIEIKLRRFEIKLINSDLTTKSNELLKQLENDKEDLVEVSPLRF